jgi:3-oxoacyl-[acyl-carrier protein] reductase
VHGADSETAPDRAIEGGLHQREHPAGYFGEPYDITNLVVFLASPFARYIIGAAIPVDGGAVRRV